jgi:CRISPR/Cas system-associated exonuclease Cas4 (RecB family)
MPWAKPTTITSWSFSRWQVYGGQNGCPFKAKQMFIEKIKVPTDPDGPMARGDRIHKLADAYIKGELRALPAELSKFADFFKRLRAAFKKTPDRVAIEETWAMRSDWTVTRWDDWNGCWVRIKLDVALLEKTVVSVVDHKTGKFSPQWNLDEYLLQLDLYALGALIKFAHLGEDLCVVPRLHFLDHGIIYPPEGEERIYVPADLPKLKKEWAARVRPMLVDKKFAPKPNRFCSSCHFRKDNKANGGGQCKF